MGSDSAAAWVYWGVFAALVAAGLGFPIPEELPIVTAGALVGHAADDPLPPADPVGLLAASPTATPPAQLPWGSLARLRHVGTRIPLRWWIMLPVCILGVVISDGLLYTIGRLGGRRLLERKWVRRLLPPAKRRRIEDNFRRYGVWVLLFARFLPAIRSPIFVTAGIMRLPLGRFLLADGIYALPGVSLLFFLAFWFGDQFRDLVEHTEQRVRSLAILLALVVVAGLLLYRFLRRPVATGDPAELPLIGDQVAATLEQSRVPLAEPAAGEKVSVSDP
ncbi:MAG: DedA family protein [Gemmataceae bacterium]|nr:DedA family protein [Gemmataceae bacterium]MDW8264231.1 DedA family protein [Gemmataceae bacterium]